MIRLFNKIKEKQGVAFDSILLAIIQIVAYIANIFTTKILAMELSLYEYGSYSTVNTVITIAASLTLFGLGDTINYFFNKQSLLTNEKERREYVNTIFMLQSLIGIFIGILLVICSSKIAIYYRNIMIQYLILIVCMKPWLSNAIHLYQVLFVSNKKAKLIAIRNFIISILKIILLYIVIKLFKNIYSIFVCLLVLDVIQLLIFKYIFGIIRFKIKIFSYNKEKIIPIIKYSMPMGIYFVTITLMREIDKLVVGRFGSTEELAIYSNCAKTLPLNFIVVSFATVLIPYIMKYVSMKDYQTTAQVMEKYFTIGYLSVWMLSVGILLCSSEAICFFYSKEYVIGVPIFIIYIFDGMIHFASMHLVIAANGDSNYLMKKSFVLMIVNIVFSIVLYKILLVINLALIGPAIATLFTSIIYIFILINKSAKIMEIKIRKFLPIKKMIIYLIKLSIVGIVFYFFKTILKSLNIHWLLVLIIISSGFYIVVLMINFKEFKRLFSEINQIKAL